jgi:hypothetical protein
MRPWCAHIVQMLTGFNLGKTEATLLASMAFALLDTRDDTLPWDFCRQLLRISRSVAIKSPGVLSINVDVEAELADDPGAEARANRESEGMLD